MTHLRTRHLHVLLAMLAGPCFGGGTLRTEELGPLMAQHPDVRDALTSALVLSDSAYAEVRLGPHFTNLGGARVGPYTIRAIVRQTGRELELVLCTKIRFLDSNGLELPEGRLEEAARVDEQLTTAMLHELSPAHVGAACP